MKERIITVPVTAHVPLHVVERIEAAARRQGVTRASYVKKLLRIEVARLEAAAAAEKEPTTEPSEIGDRCIPLDGRN